MKISDPFPLDSRISFVITGPSGWVGKALVAYLIGRLGVHWRDRLTAFASSERSMSLQGDLIVPVRALSSLTPEDVENAVVYHLAFQGLDKASVLSEAAFFDTNIALDRAVLSAIQEGRPRALFVSSSGMAREALSGANRNLYGLTKLLQEDRFLSFGRATGVRTLVGRIFSVAGPYINKVQAYALASFLLQGRQSGRIQIQAPVPVYRSFLHVDDLSALITAALLDAYPLPNVPIDLAGQQAVEMQDLAMAACDALGLSHSAIERPEIDYDRPNLYLGDPVAARTFALRHDLQLKELRRQVEDTRDYLQSEAVV